MQGPTPVALTLINTCDRHAPGASASPRCPPRVPPLLASIGWFSFPMRFCAVHARTLA